jgi:pyridoxal phosphate enzyme (YggS family)
MGDSLPCVEGFFRTAAGILTGMDPAAIAGNLEHVRALVARAAERAGRHPEDVKLIAVSKTQPPAAVAAAVAAGQRIFGENTVQDALSKIPQFQGQGIEWHFIGHLQSNKVKFIPGNFAWVHSIDSVKIIHRLARFAGETNTAINALIEVNITRDPGKHGLAPEALVPFLDQLLREDLQGVHLHGLMAIGPQSGNESELRAAYAAVRQLRDDCVRRFALPGFTELSMGMSGDFAEAIFEGATMVRIGEAIFGARRSRAK